MSHYTVAVILDGNQLDKETGNRKDIIESFVANALAPFDEDIEVEPYISQTKDEIEDERLKLIKAHEEKDDSRYNLKFIEEHIKDIQTLKDYIKTMHGGFEDFDKNFNLISTYNPKSKWDWYAIRGRWNSALPRLSDKIGEAKEIRVSDLKSTLKETVYALLTKEGEWLEPGLMGWFGVSHASKEDRETFDIDNELKKHSSQLPMIEITGLLGN